VYRRLVAGGVLVGGVAADDGAALHFVGSKLAAVVTSRPEARACRVERVRGKAVETWLETRYLGKAK
jgi:dipeptidase E